MRVAALGDHSDAPAVAEGRTALALRASARPARIAPLAAQRSPQVEIPGPVERTGVQGERGRHLQQVHRGYGCQDRALIRPGCSIRAPKSTSGRSPWDGIRIRLKIWIAWQSPGCGSSAITTPASRWTCRSPGWRHLKKNGHAFEYLMVSGQGHNNMDQTFASATDWIRNSPKQVPGSNALIADSSWRSSAASNSRLCRSRPTVSTAATFPPLRYATVASRCSRLPSTSICGIATGVTDVRQRDVVVLAPEKRHVVERRRRDPACRARGLSLPFGRRQCSTRMRAPSRASG